MFTAIYRWRIKDGMEAQFVDGWERVTRAIHEACGSYGSRLHRCDDGTWLAYARWPDAATRDRCAHGDAEGSRLMREAIEERFDEILAEVVSDLLREPPASPSIVGELPASR